MNIENKDRHDLDRDLLAFQNMQKNGDKSQEVINAIMAIEAEIQRREAPLPRLTNFGPGGKSGSSVGSPISGGFSSFGEQMSAVMRAGLPSGQTDARLFNAATGLGETVPSDGGFLVQSDFSNSLLKGVFETGKLASLCNKIQISSGANKIELPAPDESSRGNGSRFGGIRGYWSDEAAEATASKPTFRNLTLSLKKLIGLCYATDELLADAKMLETVLRQGFADEFGFLIDDAIVNGSGAGTFLGLMAGGGLVTQNKEAGQAAATVTVENVIKMWSRMLPGSQSRSVWLVNNDVLPALYTMSLAVGTGGSPVFLPGGGVSDQPYASLFGRPVIPIEQCQTLGTTGDIILADLAGGYLLAEKGGMQSDVSIHVRFVYGEQVFRFMMRLDGQPVLNSAVTPYKGSATQGHFVALQTRS